MENTQVSKLKINATNIKNSLFRSNKELINLKKERLKISFTQEERKKISKKESSAESSPSFLQSVKNIGNRLISGPLSFIDKFKEFFGLILLGIVVNNLPAIVQKLQDTFIKIQTFFDQNPWIMDAVKFGFEMIGKGIMGLAKFIRFIGPYIGGSFTFALKTLKSTRVLVEELVSTFVDLDLSFGKLAKDLNVDKIPDASKDPSRYSNFVAGGGKKALEEKGLTVDEVVDQGKKNISRSGTRPRSPQPQSQPQKPVQKLARGGTVKVDSSSNFSRSRSASPFTASESGKAKKARESINYFQTFNQTVDKSKQNSIVEKNNIDLFEEMTSNFKEFSKLFSKFSLESPPPGPGPGPGDSGPPLINGDVYEADGGELPSKYRGRGINPPTGEANHNYPARDYEISKGNPISVFVPGEVIFAGMRDPAGYGQEVVVRHTNGNMSQYAHLSQILVKQGDKIESGQTRVIGKTGGRPGDYGAGRTSGEHLHFELRDSSGNKITDYNTGNYYFRFGGNIRVKKSKLDPVSGGNNAEKIWNFFKAKQLSDIAVAGILGNARQETGPNIDPSIAYSESIQGKPARFIGIFQWGNNGNGGRWNKLVNWAKKEKKNPESIDTQLQFAWHELENSESTSLSLIKKAKSPEEAAQIWYDEYERASHGLTQRKAYAKSFYQRYKGKTPGPPRQPAVRPADPIGSGINRLMNTLLRSSSEISSPENSLFALEDSSYDENTSFIINRTFILEKTKISPVIV